MPLLGCSLHFVEQRAEGTVKKQAQVVMPTPGLGAAIPVWSQHAGLQRRCEPKYMTN